MSWLVTTPDGEKISSDDFTLDEADAVEKMAGQPWVILNPLHSMASAKAFIAIGWVRAGHDAAEINDRLSRLTLADIKGAFEFVPEPEQKGRKPDPKARPRRSANSPENGSDSGPVVSDGPRPLRAANG